MGEAEAELGRGMAENGHGSELQAAAMAGGSEAASTRRSCSKYGGCGSSLMGPERWPGEAGAAMAAMAACCCAEAATSRGRKRLPAAARRSQQRPEKTPAAGEGGGAVISRKIPKDPMVIILGAKREFKDI